MRSDATRSEQAGQFASASTNPGGSGSPSTISNYLARIGLTQFCGRSHLDARTSIRSLKSPGVPIVMKTSFRLLAALSVLFIANFVQAGDFVSQVVQASGSFTITVPGDRFLVIRNFTQVGPATVRGTVSATDRTGLSGTVLTTTIVDPSNLTSLEPVNDVVVSGPSTVTVTAGDTNCFITYRKGQD